MGARLVFLALLAGAFVVCDRPMVPPEPEPPQPITIDPWTKPPCLPGQPC